MFWGVIEHKEFINGVILMIKAVLNTVSRFKMATVAILNILLFW